MNRRRFVQIGAGAAAGSVISTGLYAWRMEPRWLERVDHLLPIPGLPSPLHGATLVQLSDLHLGPSVEEDYVRHVFRIVDAMRPDLVAITGDWVTWRGGEQLRMLRRVLVALPRARRGVFGILGNHDWGHGWRDAPVADAVAREAEIAGVTMLRNRAVPVGDFMIAGTDDLWAGHCAPQPFVAEGALRGPSLVLCHNPDALDEPGWGGYQGWTLSGHTHGGQVHAPFLAPPLLPVKNRRYSRGRVAVGDGRHVYINRGIGHTARVRFLVRPEITVHRLVPSDGVRLA